MNYFTKSLTYLSILMVPFLFSNIYGQSSKENALKDESAFVNNLISKMNLEEKVGQMTQVTIDVVLKTNPDGTIKEPQEIDLNKLKDVILNYHIGSILNVSAHAYDRKQWFDIISSIQNMSVKQARLNIPCIYGIDAIHGVTYTPGAILFPQEIGMAATFNPELIRKAGEISAYETRASYIPWNFSPVLDLGLNPLWPRIYETFGEDPYLAKTMGSAIIQGYQGLGNGDSFDKYHVVSCMKHYIGYSFPRSGKDRTPAWMPERYMREYFLPTFQNAILAGSKTLMVNSGEINGIPVHASHYLLTNLLKEELGYSGLVVSDWEDIKALVYRHHIASNFKEAAEIAVNAGIDMSMVPLDLSFAKDMVQSVNEGKVPMSRIDDAVRRILKVKYELNLWKSPIGNPKDYPNFGSEAHRLAAQKTAEESIILLKNENSILPLHKGQKVLVTGPSANTMRSLNGGWSYSWQGERTDEFAKEKNNILEALQKYAGDDIRYVPGSDFEKGGMADDAVQAAKDVDLIVLCLGETSYTETPGNINDLSLPDAQMELAEKLAATGKPIVLVLAEGRPRIINRIEPKTKAIVLSLLTGNEGGDALAKILYGEVSPSGKLPLTYPKYVNSLFTYFHKPSEELGAKTYAGYDPQFEFGFGLTYSTFAYSNLKLSDSLLTNQKPIQVSIDLKNTGSREAKEVVQLYTGETTSSLSPDGKRLRHFEKVSLAPGETKTLHFQVESKDLSFIGLNDKPVMESGNYKLMVGDKVTHFKYLDGSDRVRVLDRF